MANKKQTTLKINVTMQGAQDTLKSFRQLPKEASAELRDRSKNLAQALVGPIKQAAQSDPSPQAALFAPTVRVRRDRVPAITVGGKKRVGRRKVPVFRVLFGAEFGSNQYRQFGKRHVGNSPEGPVFSIIERERGRIAKAWQEAADEIIEKFTDTGGGQ